VNVTRGRKLTNIRAAGREREHHPQLAQGESLEKALEWLSTRTSWWRVTPQERYAWVRKKVLPAGDRYRLERERKRGDGLI